MASSRTSAQTNGELASLGERLFLDKSLSVDGHVSCSSCHDPAKAFGDGKPVSTVLKDFPGTRNAPSLLNVAEYESLLWDGRKASVKEQVLDPFTNAREHGFQSRADLVDLIGRRAEYLKLFADAFGTRVVDADRIARALEAFVRSLDAGVSRFDRFQYAGGSDALSSAEKQGLEIFRGVAKCGACHMIGESRASFTDNNFHALAVGGDRLAATLDRSSTRSISASPDELARLITSDPDIAALGRFNVTRKPSDIGKYRTPTLRNIALTAPYMHDGSVPSLEEAVENELYYRSAQMGRPVVLTPLERANLIAFLRSLTSELLEANKESHK